MMQHFDKQHALKEFLTKIRIRISTAAYPSLRMGFLFAGIVLVLAVSAILINPASAKKAAADITTFCSRTTFYGGILHCQIGDKDYRGWYDKTNSVPSIATLKIRNVNGNPVRKGKLTIYTPRLYCEGNVWDNWIGHGYIEVNGQRFATCRGDANKLGKDGFNDGANYLFGVNATRIITNIVVAYGEAIRIKVFGSIYAETHDDCRKAEYGKCLYPAISSCWLYSYSKTTNQNNDVANFYRKYKTLGSRKIYDFVTISMADMDLDTYHYDYYDCEDWQMTFAILH